MPLNIVQEKSARPALRRATEDRRADLRERLIDCAERRIAAEGLAGLRAREIAKEIGCAVGAIYNLVADLDELVLLVGQRTNRDLGAAIDAAALASASAHATDEPRTQAAIEAANDALLVAWAWAYFRYARDNQPRWRALFEFRMPPDATLPDWFEQDQADLFAKLESRLAPLMPGLDVKRGRRRARALFSAVHGIVMLGLEDKFSAMPADTIEEELEVFVRAYLRGLRS
jgi:AcrR family transcriptional regulator